MQGLCEDGGCEYGGRGGMQTETVCRYLPLAYRRDQNMTEKNGKDFYHNNDPRTSHLTVNDVDLSWKVLPSFHLLVILGNVIVCCI